MLFQQLKILLWRNAILKKRAIVSTVLEIIIPTLIILILAKNSSTYSNEITLEPIKNVPPYVVNNDTRISKSDIKNEYYISFSEDFNKEQQNLFIENFKKDYFFKTFQFIESNNNFTEGGFIDYYINDYGELEPDDYGFDDYDEIEGEKGKEVETNGVDDEYTMKQNVTQEYKIYTFNSEDEFLNFYNKHSFQDTSNYVSTEKYAIAFKSLTEYKLFFETYDTSELIDRLVTQDDYSSYNYKSYLNAFNLQTIVNNAIIKSLTNSPNPISNIEFRYKVMDRAGYKEKYDINVAQSFTPFLMLFYFVPCVCTLLSNLVIEKESKIKESLVIVGLKKSSFLDIMGYYLWYYYSHCFGYSHGCHEIF